MAFVAVLEAAVEKKDTSKKRHTGKFFHTRIKVNSFKEFTLILNSD